MKTVLTYFFVVALISIVGTVSSVAQSAVVGHATAEVVESVNASALTILYISSNSESAQASSLKRASSNIIENSLISADLFNQLPEQAFSRLEMSDLKKFKISYSTNFVCNVMLNNSNDSSSLDESDSDSSSINIYIINNGNIDYRNNSKYKKSSLTYRQISDESLGKCNMVLAYN